MLHMQRYKEWLNNPALGEAARDELASISADEKEIAERFHKDLEFGTGGLRGIIGAGTNRMNIYTVRRASQGLADYILQTAPEAAGRGVAISYDSRNLSKDFALQTALIMVQNGIKAYVFEDMRPTPQLSFAVRELNCIAGVMITASHNPPEYNGYKAYWEDGGQLAFPQDEEVIGYVNKIDNPAALKVADEVAARRNGHLVFLGAEMDKKYLARVGELALNPEIVAKMADDFTIVYTPLYGAGRMPVTRALENAGFKNVHLVQAQALPNPQFPSLKYPNPEDPAAFTLAIEEGEIRNADIVIATDPDADRVGAMIKNASGKFELLSGNAVGVLLAEYILSQKTFEKAGIISTFVSTRLTAEIAKFYGVGYVETFTGFKNIAAEIRRWEADGSHNYIYGFEESFGYLAGDFARDKDAISASMLICEAAAFYKSQGKTLFDALNDIYARHGHFREITHSITLPGLDGAAKIREMMANLRENPPAALAETAITEIRDYAKHTPPSNMLYFSLADGSWFCVRPSGTEPKIKIYLGTKAQNASEADEKLQTYSEILRNYM
ncbi:MAG: phospho-sugar mutase [Clostridiales bacterium]|jgi:phosphoglucomutase|nr:phospho-sugar mutase [Clostridiales bacterium]